MRYRVPAFVLLMAMLPLTAHAEHAKIILRVMRVDAQTGKTTDEATASADQEPPAGGVIPRSVFKAKAHEPLLAQFIFTNAYPHGEFKDVVIRYFIVREDKAGQKILPDLTKETITQGRFVLNLKPKGRVGARVAFTIPDPGVYLLRIDSANTKSDHEHFSAIDLQVE
jgi:hypothetical protein